MLPRPAAYRRLMREEGVPAGKAEEVHNSFADGSYQPATFRDFVVSKAGRVVCRNRRRAVERRLSGLTAHVRLLPSRQVTCPKGRCPNAYLASHGYQVSTSSQRSPRRVSLLAPPSVPALLWTAADSARALPPPPYSAPTRRAAPAACCPQLGIARL